MPSTTGTAPTPSQLAVPFGDAVTITPPEPTQPSAPVGPPTVSVVRWGAVDQPRVLRRLQVVGLVGGAATVVTATAAPDPLGGITFVATVAAMIAASRASRTD